MLASPKKFVLCRMWYTPSAHTWLICESFLYIMIIFLHIVVTIEGMLFFVVFCFVLGGGVGEGGGCGCTLSGTLILFSFSVPNSLSLKFLSSLFLLGTCHSWMFPSHAVNASSGCIGGSIGIGSDPTLLWTMITIPTSPSSAMLILSFPSVMLPFLLLC